MPDLRISSDDRIQLAVARHVNKVSSVLGKSFIVVLRILAGNSLIASDTVKCLEKFLSCYAIPVEYPCAWCTVLGKKSMFKGAVAAILGSIIYRVIYAVVLKTRIVPMQGLKLMTAVVVAFAIAFPTIKEQLHFARKKHRASKGTSGKEDDENA